MNFRKREGGLHQSEKFVAKKRNIVLRNEGGGGGGGQKPFGSFPKIHPKWYSSFI